MAGMNAGDAGCTVGLSSRIYNEMITPTGGEVFGFSGSLTTAQQNSLKALCYAIAIGVVAEIQANAAVAVTVHTTDTGLQTSTTIGSATNGPASNKTLGGTVS